jgi:hypothetical protein
MMQAKKYAGALHKIPPTGQKTSEQLINKIISIGEN